MRDFDQADYLRLVADQLTERAAEAWTIGYVVLAERLFASALTLVDGLNTEADR